jgi:hypothetical protein
MAKKKAKRKATPLQRQKAEALDEEIERLELHEMSGTEIERTVKAFSKEGIELRAKRKKIRYKLYRCRTVKAGSCASDCTLGFKRSFEKQPFFAGWLKFAVTWDVAFDDPRRIVNRDLSEAEEWAEIVKAKFPQLDHNGKVTYPDINVRKRVEAEARKQANGTKGNV